MNDVSWGVPTQAKRKTEKFDTPVVTMSALSEKGSGRKFNFNKAAQSLLGLIGGESHVKVGFGKDNNIYIQSLIAEEDSTFSMTNSCTFSNKRIYEYIAKMNNLNSTEENYLHLKEVEGQSYVTVSHISSDNSPETQDNDVPTMNAPDEVEEAEVVEEDWN